MTILGDVALDEDGVLHGWCWCPWEPQTRRRVDIMLDDTLAASSRASRFREDLRLRHYGDGYHGFSVTLSKQLATANHALLSARDQATGVCFWQKLFGSVALPASFTARIDRARHDLQALARAEALTRPGHGEGARLVRALSGLEAQLNIRAPAPMPRFTLPRPARPAYSLIFDAWVDAEPLLHALQQAAPSLHERNVEILLTDGGADPRTANLQARAANLTYCLGPGQPAAARRNDATALARGTRVIFLNHAAHGLDATLAALPQQPAGALILSGALASAVARMVRTKPAEAAFQASTGLQLAADKSLLTQLGGFDPEMDDGAGLELLDFTLRAARQNVPLICWGTPGVAVLPPSRNTEAGERFARRWLMGVL